MFGIILESWEEYPQQWQRHMALPSMYMWESTNKKPKNIMPQQTSAPHCSNITSIQFHMVIHTNQHKECGQQTTWLNNPRMTTHMHIFFAQCQCQCQAQLRHDKNIPEAPTQSETPILPSPTHIVQFIEFTYFYDWFPNQALEHKHTKYNPLINSIHNNGWKVDPLISITIMDKRSRTQTFHQKTH